MAGAEGEYLSPDTHTHTFPGDGLSLLGVSAGCPTSFSYLDEIRMVNRRWPAYLCELYGDILKAYKLELNSKK